MSTNSPEPVIPKGFVLASKEGHKVVLRQIEAMSVPIKGHLLLLYENQLRQTGDREAEVYLEAKQDLNLLRQRLRGVKI